MEIGILDIAQKLGIQGTDLNSRDWGVMIREEVEERIKKKDALSEIVYLDFTGITSFNSSIADEVIVRLMRKLIDDENNIFLVSQGIPDNSLYDLELVTAHRKIPCLIKVANKRRPVIICGENASKMENNQRLIYDIVMRLGKCTARGIADLLEKDIYTASTYLNKLYKMRVLKRVEQIDKHGKQYIYMPVF